jgi:hypothetical protein
MSDTYIFGAPFWFAAAPRTRREVSVVENTVRRPPCLIFRGAAGICISGLNDKLSSCLILRSYDRKLECLDIVKCGTASAVSASSRKGVGVYVAAACRLIETNLPSSADIEDVVVYGNMIAPVVLDAIPSTSVNNVLGNGDVR